MKVKIVSKKLIKPCTPTPPNLNQYNLSYTDETSPPMNVGIILFYPPNPNTNIPKEIGVHIHELEKSLSEILPQFYPLAGRFIKNDHLVDCSDQGVEFVEAAVDDDVDFIGLVSKMKLEELNDLLPSKFRRVYESPTDPLVSIQVTEFKCGGLAISVSVTHRIFDASSVGTFIAAWSNAANNKNPTMAISPSFESPSLFPGRKPPAGGPPELSSPSVDPPSVTVKKYTFNIDAIRRLKSSIISKNSMSVSRVRVVCAVIAKALVAMDRAILGGKSRPCLIVQAVNIRARTNPPIPKHSCGNLSMMSLTRFVPENDDVIGKNNSIQELVDALGDSLQETIADCYRMFSLDANSIIMDPVATVRQALAGDEVNVVMISDWSKFGFYGADFGWGKPIGAGIGPFSGEKMIVLMDSKEGDGIEAWVHLNADDMAYFEQDEDIKLYTV
ncbi:hypothetical protein ABFS83_07G072600 [Erythranthe nasuta]